MSKSKQKNEPCEPNDGGLVAREDIRFPTIPNASQVTVVYQNGYSMEYLVGIMTQDPLNSKGMFGDQMLLCYIEELDSFGAIIGPNWTRYFDEAGAWQAKQNIYGVTDRYDLEVLFIDRNTAGGVSFGYWNLRSGNLTRPSQQATARDPIGDSAYAAGDIYTNTYEALRNANNNRDWFTEAFRSVAEIKSWNNMYFEVPAHRDGTIRMSKALSEWLTINNISFVRDNETDSDGAYGMGVELADRAIQSGARIWQDPSRNLAGVVISNQVTTIILARVEGYFRVFLLDVLDPMGCYFNSPGVAYGRLMSYGFTPTRIDNGHLERLHKIVAHTQKHNYPVRKVSKVDWFTL